MVARVREALAGQPGLTGRKMFGSYAFFLDGNMCAGVHQDRLLIRTRSEDYETMLARPDVIRFPEEGRAMHNWVTIDPDATAEDSDLAEWLRASVSIARSLPPK